MGGKFGGEKLEGGKLEKLEGWGNLGGEFRGGNLMEETRKIRGGEKLEGGFGRDIWKGNLWVG